MEEKRVLSQPRQVSQLSQKVSGREGVEPPSNCPGERRAPCQVKIEDGILSESYSVLFEQILVSNKDDCYNGH